MTISLLAYVVAFSGQLYFWKNNTPSHFFRVTTSAQQLLFRSSYFFRDATYLWSVLFQNSHHFAAFIFSFFRIATFSEQNFYQKASSSSLRQVLFEHLTFLIKKLFRHFQERYFFEPGNSAQHQIFQKSYFSEKANFSEKQYSALPTFPGWLLF